ncbi:S8 family serine peptidase (plasmid) [Streptomyces sp. NBC_01527]|uniref:S8 family serine peptidase n=1 Tax=unclassified Streptomyces TaxID=2593676 RepID=UPI002E0E9E7A|nr:S8 family serine peptidase [Streptomyces sp. NBC_01230]
MLMAIPPASASDGAAPTPASNKTAVGSNHPIPRTVTLITGDRVTVTPGGDNRPTITVEGPDGHRADARITTQHGDTYVYPFAAERFVAAGLLDPDLFDVTRLVADGYDDAHSHGLPVILTYPSAARRKQAAPQLPDGATRVRALTSIDATALTQEHNQAAGFWTDLTQQPSTPQGARTGQAVSLAGGVQKVWLDGKIKADLAESTAQIGAPSVWKAGNTGQGVDVAVLDTGYDTDHPDLQGVVASAASFVPDEDVADHNGHGTHVASTIAGNGAASAGKEKGVAPGVRLHVGKVLSNDGSGYDSWIISGMEWAARDARARVVSMSLGGDRPSDGTDPLSRAVNELSAETGALFTIAAGNAGPSEGTVATPGAADAALTVGAVDSSDALAEFSSRGPRFRDGAIKPEITAPGVGILAARSQWAHFGSGPYATLSGTSMATPHVAGAAALVAAKHPDWDGPQIKDALVSTAAATARTAADEGGNGRVDAAAAMGRLTATGTADFGIHPPSKASGTVSRSVRWTNSGDTDVVVIPRIKAADAPNGLFTITDRPVSVPAHGSTGITVTTDLDRAPAGSRFTGDVEGVVDGKVVTRTLLAVSVRIESQHLRVHLIDRSGDPLPGMMVNYRRKGDDFTDTVLDADLDGTVDTVVPPGTYTVWSWSVVRGTHGKSSAGRALMAKTSVLVTDGATDTTLDGTKLRRTEVITPQTSTDSYIRADFNQSFTDNAPAIADSTTVGDAFDSVWAMPMPKTAGSRITYTVRWRMEEPLLALSSGSQAFDDLWLQPGSGTPADGTRTLPAVFAGNGTAAEYAAAGARNKVAVVRHVPDDDEDDDDDRVSAAGDDQYTAARKAGVALLVVVNDLDGRLREPTRRTDLVIAGLSRTEGETLIRRIQDSRAGWVPIHVVGHETTAYLYDLVHTWQGAIPQTQRYQPALHHLARVDVGFRSEPGAEVEEFRFDMQPYLGAKVGITRPVPVGARRTDWVTPAGEATWMEEASIGVRTMQFSGLVDYPAGRTTDVQWFAPIEHPRLNEAQKLPSRIGNSLDVLLPAWGDGGRNHVGVVGPGSTSQANELYRNGHLYVVADGQSITAEDLPTAASSYRLVTTTKRTEGYPYSTATRTEWAFSSAAPRSEEPQVLPLLQLDYDLRTDRDGRAGRDAELTVMASALPGLSAGTVRTDLVEVSYDDGRTWHHRAQRSTRTGSFQVRLDAPGRAAYVSLRVHASGRGGETVTQTVIRAAGLS